MSICERPTSLEALVALWMGELPDPEAAALEEHLFACDECALASERLAKLVAGLRERIPPVISHAFRARLVAKGMRVCNTPVQPNRVARARFAPDVDLLVHVLMADLSLAERVDVECISEDGISRFLFEHV